MDTLDTIKILDITVTSDSEKSILEFIITRLRKKGSKTKIFTPNPEIITYATKHPSLKKILNSGDVNLPDGVGLVWAARLMGKRLQGRITGVDFMQKLCKECAKEGVSIGLLGGKGDVALRAAECLVDRFPGIKIVYVSSEWTEDGWLEGGERGTTLNKTRNYAEALTPSATRLEPKGNCRAGPTLSQTSFRRGRESEPSESGSTSDRLVPRTVPISSVSDSIGILFVAFGFPKQEEWIAENIDRLPVQAMMGVGGSFDFLSGKVSRAPKWVQSLGLEWLYRLIRQPWRWKRQVALVEFIKLVINTRS